jgi:hypothetical protein
VSHRPTLRELRHDVLLELDDHEWRTPSEIADSLGLDHGVDWLKVAVTLERLVVDGEAEIKGAGSRVRRFRSRAS